MDLRRNSKFLSELRKAEIMANELNIYFPVDFIVPHDSGK